MIFSPISFCLFGQWGEKRREGQLEVLIALEGQPTDVFSWTKLEVIKYFSP